ncbi:unnamed protein product [Adineta steineri]|uniref:cAMP-dependent protein kinase n=1 Tax=Adineta steineri TaxID=433720 RepID=A0A814VN17_9BILA|nr:unnamed protein product [Adineta steineri]
MTQNQTNIETNSYLERAKHEFEMKYNKSSAKTANIEDFQLKRTIGKGSFARVMLVKHGNQSLALKIMKKRVIVEQSQVMHILSEKCILEAVNSPFIVNLIYAFKDNAYLYLALEFGSGGDMFTKLQRADKISEKQACFYAAQIVLALEYLHYLSFHSIVDIIYRNIKPEDILFAADGYLKLTDFGFAKVVQDRTFTLCGTTEYLAPEIIDRIGHDKGVDYWALGVLIYEMTNGSTPFYADDPMQTYTKIRAGRFDIPRYFSSDLKDLIRKLLEHHSANRYGCLEGGTADIKNHIWFSSIDWIALGEKRLEAPFIPNDFESYCERSSCFIKCDQLSDIAISSITHIEEHLYIRVAIVGYRYNLKDFELFVKTLLDLYRARLHAVAQQTTTN